MAEWTSRSLRESDGLAIAMIINRQKNRLIFIESHEFIWTVEIKGAFGGSSWNQM